MVKSRLPGTGDVTRLTLLSLLALEPMHGYKLSREIRARRMDRWADVKPGSIYAGLKRLAAEGLVEVAATTRAGGRPKRTTYRITRRGRTELHRRLRDTLALPAHMVDPVDVALSFATLLPAAEVAEMLEQRLRALDAVAAELAAETSVPLEHFQRQVAMEREWVADVLARVRGRALESTGERAPAMAPG